MAAGFWGGSWGGGVSGTVPLQHRHLTQVLGKLRGATSDLSPTWGGDGGLQAAKRAPPDPHPPPSQAECHQLRPQGQLLARSWSSLFEGTPRGPIYSFNGRNVLTNALW